MLEYRNIWWIVRAVKMLKFFFGIYIFYTTNCTSLLLQDCYTDIFQLLRIPIFREYHFTKAV